MTKAELEVRAWELAPCHSGGASNCGTSDGTICCPACRLHPRILALLVRVHNEACEANQSIADKHAINIMALAEMDELRITEVK